MNNLLSVDDMIENFRQSIISTGLPPPPKIIADGKYHHYSTNGKSSDSAGWYLLDPSSHPHGAFGCWRSGVTHVWRPNFSSAISPAERELFRMKQRHSERIRQAQQRSQWAINAESNKKLLAQAKAPGEEVRSYLATRGLGAWDIPTCIRQHPGLTYWQTNDHGELEDLGTYPAMLAPIVNDGAVVSLHRTYLCEGHKAPVPQPKKLTPASGRLMGGSIPLAERWSGTLGIAEGIETAAAANLGSGIPIMAAYCANALAQYCWPKGTRRLVIFADNDDAGKEAACKLVARASKFGLETKILFPDIAGQDWADVWQEAQS